MVEKKRPINLLLPLPINNHHQTVQILQKADTKARAISSEKE
jgi:hypothetical protein